MASKNIKLKDKLGNILYPQTKASLLINDDGTKFDVVTKAYVDSGDASTLASAAADATTKANAAETAAKSYSDGNLATAKTYADGKAATAESNAKSYADDLDEATNAKVDTNTASITSLSTSVTSLGTRMGTAEGNITTLQGKVTTIEGDYLKAADKTELSTAIANEKTRAEGVEDGLDTRLTAAEEDIDAIEADYLTSADKTELEGLISGEEDRATAAEGALEVRIENLEARGRFLSSWNVGTGKPSDYPSVPSGATYPYDYNYKAGDYYIVGSIPASGDKLQPNGTKITKASAAADWTVGSKAETREVAVGDYYVYSNSSWILISNSQKTVNFENIAGEPLDNTKLATEFGKKVDKVSGYSLVSDSEITKLGTVEQDAEKNIIETVKVNNVALTPDANRAVNIDLSGKQDVIDASHKLSADLLSDGSTNHVFTAADDTKLGGIAAGATKVEASSTNGNIKINGTETVVFTEVAGTVHDASYVHTDNNFTNSLKSKLEGVEAGAQVNIIEHIKLNGSDLTVTDKRVDLGSIATSTEITRLEGLISAEETRAKAAEKVNGDAITALTARVTTNEGDISTLNTWKTSASSSITDLQTRMAAAETTIASNTSRIATLEGAAIAYYEELAA